MPPRLNKRQQRELEELEALGKPPQDIEISSEEETAIAPPKPAGGFAAVGLHAILTHIGFSCMINCHHRSSSQQPATRKCQKAKMRARLALPRLKRSVIRDAMLAHQGLDLLRQSKKKKKKATIASVDSEAAIETPSRTQKSAGQAKASAKKGKGKEKVPEKDDLDQALEELSIKCV